MFKFSLNWLRDYCSKNMKYDEIMQKLKLQGFEFAGKTEIDGDVVTEIEVKANRPDMLCHMGIAREIKAFDGKEIPEIEPGNVGVDNSKFPLKINVDESICKRFCAVKISGIDSSRPTPNYISERLNVLGINSVNAVVDIGNYIMLDVGQPMHAYDFDKISAQTISIHKAEKSEKITTFSGDFAEVKPGDIVISDGHGIKCVAGIIGTDDSAVTKQTENIVLEAAVFDEIRVRLTSRRLKISTPSSFRFERGVSAESTFNCLIKCATMIAEICGGKIEICAFDYYPGKCESNVLNLDVNNCNKLLGTNLNQKTMVNYLEKYNFKCQTDNENIIKIQIPSYRLDVKKEVDLIEEVARIYGYDNIDPVMPTLMTSYNNNAIWSNIDIVRDILTGLKFNETVNYSFVPGNTMETFGIEKCEKLYSDLILQNPIAGAYALMRPMMTYSLLNCLAYNYSISNNNLALFEMGRVYARDENSDTGVTEIDACGFIMSGIRIPRGFGVEKDVKYTYYDLLSCLKIIMDKFGQTFDLKPNSYKFFEEGSGYDIILDKKIIGFIGELNKSKLGKIQNVKLIKDKIFYGEIYVKDLTEKTKKIEFESKYPPVKRLYNLVQKKETTSKEVSELIKSSGEIVRNVSVVDIYSDKTFSEDEYAVLYEVNYCSKNSTLTVEQIECIERSFLETLKTQFGIKFKD